MELNDIMQVHIWELPLKNNDIDKSSEYMLVHDGPLKKIKVENLYNYFNQDYKVKNTIEYFENLLSKYNEEYEPKYIILGDSLNYYENNINEFRKKFTSNRDTIRSMENEMYMSGINYTNIESNIKDSENKYGILSFSYDDIKKDIDIAHDGIYNNRDNTIDYLSIGNDIHDSHINMDSKYSELKSTISFDREDIEDSVKEKKDILSKRITDEYDKLLEIFDHYHHISDV
jgi:hypothetical protein